MTTPEAVAAAGTSRFPDGFLWGAATSAYQIEGAAYEGGRGTSIWDTFCRQPGKVHRGENGDIAADHYHRYRQDVTLMRDLGLDAYRFSIAWPRVQPQGSGPANAAGIDFYSRLVDALLEDGIEPYPTLYHWDLPQELQDAGGWAARETAYRFAEYAALVAQELGDRVGTWLTLNEPWCSAFLGYGLGRHAPGIHDGAQALAAAHHLLLGHGLAVEAMRAETPAGTRFGIVLNLEPVRPATDAAEDVAAAALVDTMHNRLFLDPVLRGTFPVDTGVAEPGDERVIATPLDVLGVNYYRPATVRARVSPATEWTTWPGDEAVEHVQQPGQTTDMGWPVDATGLREMLERLRDDYAAPPVIVTENGAAYADRVDDRDRIAYLDAHLRSLHGAIEGGTDVRGYFVWSLLDNFEWAEGYAKRFGIVWVDYDTLERTPKRSAEWYRDVISANGLRG